MDDLDQSVGEFVFGGGSAEQPSTDEFAVNVIAPAPPTQPPPQAHGELPEPPENDQGDDEDVNIILDTNRVKEEDQQQQMMNIMSAMASGQPVPGMSVPSQQGFE